MVLPLFYGHGDHVEVSMDESRGGLLNKIMSSGVVNLSSKISQIDGT
jgi:hypothetical protein